MLKFNPFTGNLDFAENAKKYSINNFIVAESIADLPAPAGDAIQIASGTTIFVPSVLDLDIYRLAFAPDCCILGSSSETSKIISKLGNNVALITASGSLPIENISLEVQSLNVGDIPYIFELNGSGEVGAALDWKSVNCINSKIGNIQNYSNFVAFLCAFIETKNGFVFDGTFDSIVFSNCIFRASASSGTHIKVEPTASINRRIRIVDTPIIALSGSTAIDVSTSAAIPIEGYILRYVNFSGGGNYIVGVQHNDNKSVFYECRGVVNSANIASFYMEGNNVSTSIPTANTYVKLNGTTIAGDYVQRFTLSNNRATYVGAIPRYFSITSITSINSNSNNNILTKIAKNGILLNGSRGSATASASGRSENISGQVVVLLNNGDYIEVFGSIANTNGTITATDLSVVLLPAS